METSKKKLLIIGNKIEHPNYKGMEIPLDVYKNAIDNMDYVCRINRMHNYGVTGTKLDGLYLGGWNDFVQLYKGGEHTDLTYTAKDIYVDRRAWVGGFNTKCKQFISDQQFEHITICPFTEQKQHIQYAFPCSVLLMIDYFATEHPWCDEYEVWVTGIDIENRADVIKNGWQWAKNGHPRGAEAEEAYLKRMLAERKIHWLDKELCEQYVPQKRVPIFIPVKSFSKRCPYKNETLLPHTLEYIKKLGRIEDVVIIADSEYFKYQANVYGVKYHVQKIQEGRNEFSDIQSYLNTRPDITEFLWLPVTQPCRDFQLIDNVLKCNPTALVTSYITRADRSIYKLDDNMQFEIQDTQRKGSMCKEERVADGAIYYLSVEFFNKVMQSDDKNYTFWNSGTQFVENHSPLVDVDTVTDLLQYIKYYDRL